MNEEIEVKFMWNPHAKSVFKKKNNNQNTKQTIMKRKLSDVKFKLNQIRLESRNNAETAIQKQTSSSCRQTKDSDELW